VTGRADRRRTPCKAGLIALLSAVACLWTLPAAAAEGAFANWAAVVVAGDWHAHSGGPTEAFDNARRDVSKALVSAGFAPTNLKQFSVRPHRYADVRPAKSEPQGIYDGLSALTEKAQAGCLFYFSSHGMPQGLVLDDQVLPPAVLGEILDDACGARPTVVVLSACFSGVFVPQLSGPNRMVLTAARRDRTSFGCGEADVYPFFDECVVKTFPKVGDFAALGPAVQTCVAARETEVGARPPSEPQLYIGPSLRAVLPLYAFARAPP
jgi:hypothetical protein